MVHLWGSKSREETEMSKSALGGNVTGDIAVVIGGEQLDFNLVYLGCQMAKGARRKVPMQIAERVGCEAVAEVVQARDAGPAIVDEAKDHNCALILIGYVRPGYRASNELGKTVPYVLANAPCRVWLVQDSPHPATTR